MNFARDRVRHWVPKHRRVAATRAVLDRRLLGHVYLRMHAGFADTRLADDVALVVDGFPRSANSYAFHGLSLALGPQHRVRGHTHAVATVYEAAAAGVPTVLLVRSPDDAVASYLQMVDNLRPETAFRSYRRFHEALEPIMTQVLVVSFSTAVTDLGAVVSALNTRYGSSFPALVSSPDADKVINDTLESVNRRLNGGQLREAGVARPSPSRRAAAEVLVDLSPDDARERDKAAAIYRRFAKLAL